MNINAYSPSEQPTSTPKKTKPIKEVQEELKVIPTEKEKIDNQVGTDKTPVQAGKVDKVKKLSQSSPSGSILKSSQKKITHKPGEKADIEFENTVVSSPAKASAALNLSYLKKNSEPLEDMLEDRISYVGVTLQYIEKKFGLPGVEDFLERINFDWPSDNHPSVINFQDRTFLYQVMSLLLLFPNEEDLKQIFQDIGFGEKFSDHVNKTITKSCLELYSEIYALVTKVDILKNLSDDQAADLLEELLNSNLDEFLDSLSRNIEAKQNAFNQERIESQDMSNLRQEMYTKKSQKTKGAPPPLFIEKINEEYKQKAPSGKLSRSEPALRKEKLDFVADIQHRTYSRKPGGKNVDIKSSIQSYNTLSKSGGDQRAKRSIKVIREWISASITDQIKQLTEEDKYQLSYPDIVIINENLITQMEDYIKSLGMEGNPIHGQRYLEEVERQIDVLEENLPEAE